VDTDLKSRLARIWDTLPLDPYIPPSPTARRRRHGRFKYHCSTTKLEQLPSAAYYQSSDSNPVYGGRDRHLPGLDKLTLDALPELTQLIAGASAMIDFSYPQVLINCHLMRVFGTATEPGEPSPEGLHHDGFDFVSLHIIQRVNMEGGQSIVVDGSNRIVAAPLLATPFDSLVIDDEAFSHAGLPFFVPSGVGYRDTFLCSYERWNS
jgi:hypothetical protein